ncbi:MAG TPA: HAD-IA family hydrolase [Rhodanobacteraceae bacterium]|nr:HAD-IA family hydrolase [Rhodanobacteraceae bacterium]
MKPLPRPLDAMFFDLDGTLVDSAPDLHDALVALCAERGREPPPYEVSRAVTSRGARAIVSSGFGDLGPDAVDALLPRFIELYTDTRTARTHPFAGVEELLRKLESRGIKWGVVTNKAGFMTAPLMEQLGYAARAAAVVSGDTLPERKPHPAPLRLACWRALVDAKRCVFVGDDPRDMEAGRAAGMYTVVAGWGYLDPEQAKHWGADAYADNAMQIASWLD